jgi:hypothetical protein
MHFHSMDITQTYTVCIRNPSRDPEVEVQVGGAASASRDPAFDED